MSGSPAELSPDVLRIWREEPDRFVRDVWPGVDPDLWQDEALRAFPQSPRLALKACKGPGKSCVMAWIGWNFALTRPRPRIGCVSITGPNLKSGLWQELAIWRERSPLLQAAFEMTATEVYLRDDPARIPRIEARTWAQTATEEQIGLALAGFHAPHVMWLADESGGMHRAVLPILEAIFAGDPIEAHVVQAGNAVSRTGPLYHACVTARRLWAVIEVTGDPDDPKRSPRIPVEYAREQVAQFGRNSPYVKVAIFGEFPETAFNALIGPDEVLAAMRRIHRPDEIAGAARILGVDVAQYGDDSSVIFPRQGLQASTPVVLRNIDSVQGAGFVARKWKDWEADAAFIDASGGFGAGWIDQLMQLAYTPIGVQFAGRPHDEARYANKRTEMYFDAVQWIKRGGALPDCPELVAALSQTTYGFRGDRLQLAPKDDIKALLGYSPDHADGFVLTFAEPVQRQIAGKSRGRAQVDYDPHAHWHRDPMAREQPYDPAARWR